MSSDSRLVAGKITGVYGVKGWVKIHSYTERPENLFDYRPCYLAGVAGVQLIEFDQWRTHGKGLVAHIKGVDDRDVAATYCQRDLVVDSGQLPVLTSGEYYWQQLVGLCVYTQADGRQAEPQLLGCISSLMETGANDVMVVVPCEGSIDQRERLLPYIPDQYVLAIDLAAGTMLVDWDPEF